jgi:hypothetical protein
MSIQYIRDTYGVPAKRGGRIRFTGNDGSEYPGEGIEGVIVGTRNARLRVRFDGSKRIESLHPTWMVEYLPPLARPLTDEQKT